MLKGYKFSDEQKDRLSKSHLGQKAWNKGLKLSEDTRERMSKSHKGVKRSEKHCNNLSKALSGEKNPFYGKKHTEETKKKIRDKKVEQHIIPANAFIKGETSGSKNFSWKGGITPENHKIRNSSEYIYWRKSCFKRDNFTCQKTGVSGGKLVVHHINNFADFPELRTSIENGITLSKESHQEFHKIYGVRNNTLEQLQEYLNN